MKKTKQLKVFLLIMALCVGSAVLAGPAKRTKAAFGTLTVGNVKVTAANANDVFEDGGSVSFDASTQTLTLNNALIQDAVYEEQENGNTVGQSILFGFPSGTFTIRLIGSNNIFVPYDSSAHFSYGIAPEDSNGAKVVFDGSGSLNVMSNEAIYTSAGIYTLTDTIIKGSVKINTSASNGRWTSNGFAALSKLTLQGVAQLTAYGETSGLCYAPSFGSGYTPRVKAGARADSISVDQKKPNADIYTGYKYINITNGGSSKKSTSTTTGTGTPGKVKITKIKAAAGLFWIYWNQIIKNGKGYELQVCTSKKFTKKITYTHTMTRTTTQKQGYTYIAGLTDGTKYYVRMRAFNKVSGKKKYGKWSKVWWVRPGSRGKSGQA